MTSTLHPYPAYKDSGVEWLGEVPEHWEVRRLKTLCSDSALYGANVAATSYTARGVRFLRTTDITEEGRLRGEGVYLPKELVSNYLLEDGDVLISRSGTIGRSFLYNQRAHGPCAYAGYLVRFVPASEVLPKYIFLFTKTQAFAGFLRVMAISSTIENVNGEKYANAPLPLPPYPEQTAIVRFLDHFDRRIRRYLRAKEKLIAVLEEQKQAITHQAVTGRIDVRTGRPYPSYKDSGVEWLGEVPAHWEVRRLKGVTRLQRGYDLPADQRIPGPFPVVSSGGVIGTHLVSRCAAPGVVMGRCGSTDAIFFVEKDFWPHNTSLFVTDFQGNAQKWCYYLLSTITKADHAGKSAVPAIDRKDLFQIVVPVPPLAEQRETVRAIEAATGNLTDAQSVTKRKIELLREYRTRLIADAVTGKLDVREAAAKLPETDPLAEDDVDDPIRGDGILNPEKRGAVKEANL